MKKAALAMMCLVIAASSAAALTVEEDVTPEFVRKNPKDLSVKVETGKQGLLDFTVVLNLREPRYVVAHLTLKAEGKILAESATPAFTRNTSNTFHFSIHPRYLADSEFSLGVSPFANSNGESVPLPGTKNYRLKLARFVSAELLKPTTQK